MWGVGGVTTRVPTCVMDRAKSSVDRCVWGCGVGGVTVTMRRNICTHVYYQHGAGAPVRRLDCMLNL